MFGYVKADLTKLSEENTERYRTVYCTLCRSLKKHFGLPAKAVLNYDVTFLALLLLDGEGEEEFNEHFCPYRMKKCKMLTTQESVFFYCSCVLMMLTFEKILDNIRDEKGIKRLFYWFLKLIYLPKYRKASKYYPDLSKKIQENMALQASLEEKGTSIDRSAHPTADSLGIIFENGKVNEPLYRFGYLLGRWIYLIDAADDVDEDIKSGAYNPLKTFDKEKTENTLNLSIGEACSAYGPLKKGAYAPIIENILYEGSLAVQQKVLKGESA